METCSNTKDIIIFGWNNGEKKAIIFNPACKSWNCPHCSEVNKAEWIHQAARGSMLLWQDGATLQFVTLTSRGYTTPVSSVEYFKVNWPKLRKRAASLTKAWQPFTGCTWAYFLVPERHKSGVLHAHFVAATHIEGERWWKDNAYASGFGYIAKVQAMIDPKGVAYYIAKYLQKDAGDAAWPTNFRRVRHSQNWPIAKPANIEGWEFKPVREKDCWTEKHALLNMGWHVIDTRQ